jgi:hypothetical protein
VFSPGFDQAKDQPLVGAAPHNHSFATSRFITGQTARANAALTNRIV